MITRKLNAAKTKGKTTYTGGKIIKLPLLRASDDVKLKATVTKTYNRKPATIEENS